MKKLGITGIILGCLIIFIYVLGKGTINISFLKTVTLLQQIIMGNISNDIMQDVIYYLRLPRLILAAVIGCGLCVSGCVMQAVMRNPLADPYLLGISSGAGLGAVAAIVLGFSSIGGFDSIGFFAFIGSLIVTFSIISLSIWFNKTNTSSILLLGMALNAICSAVLSIIITVYADAERIQSVTFWLMGSMQNALWKNIVVLSFVVGPITLFFIKNSRILNLMLLGDDLSVTLGYNLANVRRFYIFLCAVIVGFVVYNSGIIGFVGLIIPHIARLLFGGNNKYVLPFCASAGAVFLAGADVLSRIVVEGTEVPIGIIVAVIGAPVFVYLLISKKYGYNRK